MTIREAAVRAVATPVTAGSATVFAWAAPAGGAMAGKIAPLTYRQLPTGI